MNKTRISLDNCCYNRPYDDQSFKAISLEAEAKLHIQDNIRNGKIELAWSFMLDFENSANSYEERKESIEFGRKNENRYHDTIRGHESPSRETGHCRG